MNRTICRSVEDMQEAITWLTRCDLIAPDIETIPHKKKKSHPFIMTVCAYSGVMNGVMRSFAFQLARQKDAHDFGHPLAEYALRAMGVINACQVRKTLQNGTYDCAWFLRYGVPLANYAYDSMTLWWSRYPDLPKTLAFISSILLDNHRYWKMGRKEEDFTSHTIYAMEDTETTLLCTLRLLQWAADDPVMLSNFHRAHIRCLIALGLSMKGMEIDFGMFNEMESELQKKANEALARLRYIVDDPEFNPN